MKASSFTNNAVTETFKILRATVKTIFSSARAHQKNFLGAQEDSRVKLTLLL